MTLKNKKKSAEFSALMRDKRKRNLKNLNNTPPKATNFTIPQVLKAEYFNYTNDTDRLPELSPEDNLIHVYYTKSKLSLCSREVHYPTFDVSQSLVYTPNTKTVTLNDPSLRTLESQSLCPMCTAIITAHNSRTTYRAVHEQYNDNYVVISDYCDALFTHRLMELKPDIRRRTFIAGSVSNITINDDRNTQHPHIVIHPTPSHTNGLPRDKQALTSLETMLTMVNTICYHTTAELNSVRFSSTLSENLSDFIPQKQFVSAFKIPKKKTPIELYKEGKTRHAS